MPVRLILGDHMKTRLYERGIDVGEMKQVLLYPDSAASTYGKKMRARKKLDNGKVLEVIYIENVRQSPNVYFIVTAYYLKKYV